jgi:3-oxocholest-4-en-26-oate---CoA ligase
MPLIVAVTGQAAGSGATLAMLADMVMRSATGPALDRSRRGEYDLSGLVTISNGGAPMTSVVRERLRAVLPSVILFDGVGSSKSGMQMSAADIPGVAVDTATFAP